jgi:hypothetical protein
LEAVKREFKQVPLRKIHWSSVLPLRDSYNSAIVHSIKNDGVQLPLIVRPHPNKPDEYEIIDGSARMTYLKTDDLARPRDDLVTVEVRHGLTDSDVFRLSNITFLRKQRSTGERAEFIDRWIRTVAAEGNERGAQAKVAKDAYTTESTVSQYVSIHKMFQVLEALPEKGTLNFDALKNQGINKLYNLASLTDSPSNLYEVAKQLSDHPKMSLEQLKKIADPLIEKDEDHACLPEFIDEQEWQEHWKKAHTQTVKITAETLVVAEKARENLKIFEDRLNRISPDLLNTEILTVLFKLQRRLKRLERDTTKLSDYIMQKPLKKTSDTSVDKLE